ncbi:hypothetical protein H4582DRAFT_18549 [Lactarius indigo]|nr:hypothetical protein H4582DRAFT_18549 [Lactarius indigo]
MSHIIFRVLRWFTLSDFCRRGTSRRFEELKDRYHKMLLQGMLKAVEETTLKSPPEIDTRAFLWTFDSLDEDNELERFFSGLPGYRSLEVVGHLLLSLAEEQKRKLSTALLGLADRTFSSSLLPEPVQNRRATICAKASDPKYIPESMKILDKLLSIYREGRPLATEIVQIVRGWGNNDLSLAVLIHVIRQQLNHYDKPSWPAPDFFYVLEAASEFDVRDTSPEPQHEFCALWNQIALKVQSSNNGRMVSLTLRPIRHIYIALHQDTDSAPTQFSASTNFMDKILREPSAYPMCNVAGHTHNDAAPTTFTHAVPHDNITSVPPSMSVPTPPHIVESLTKVPLPDNSNPANQTTTKSPHIPVTSPDRATAGAIRDVVTSGTTIPPHTPETSTSAPPLSSTSPPATLPLPLQHNADLPTPSDPFF